MSVITIVIYLNAYRDDAPLGLFFFFSSRRRHTRYWRDWSSDVCSSDLGEGPTHGLGDQVHGVRGAVGRRHQLVALEHVQHLDERGAAGADGRHREHVVSAVGAAQRLASARLVGGEVRLGDETAAGDRKS